MTKSRIFWMNTAEKLKTVILYDGRNNVVKHEKAAVELFDEFTNLVDRRLDLFEHDVLITCEIIISTLHTKLIQKIK